MKKLISISTLISVLYNKVASVFRGSGIERYYLIRAVDNLFASLLKKDKAYIEKLSITLDKSDSLRLSVKERPERLYREIIQSVVKKGDIVIDIGAHIGLYSLLLARKVGVNGKVFSFEPSLTNFKILNKNIQNNGFKNIFPICKAVSDTNNQAFFYLSRSDSGDNRLDKPYLKHKKIIVECIRSSTFIKNIGRVNLIKLDVQGAEYRILKDIEPFLKKNKHIKIVAEFWPYGLEMAGASSSTLLDMMIASGFNIYNIDKQRDLLIKSKKTDLLERYTVKKRNATDILFSKEDVTLRVGSGI